MICADTNRMEGCFYQPPRQCQYAKQYGSYFAIADGTFGTNKYKLCNVPFITVDCAGITHLFGTLMNPTEKPKRIAEAAEMFGISARLPSIKSADVEDDALLLDSDMVGEEVSCACHSFNVVVS